MRSEPALVRPKLLSPKFGAQSHLSRLYGGDFIQRGWHSTLLGNLGFGWTYFQTPVPVWPEVDCRAHSHPWVPCQVHDDEGIERAAWQLYSFACWITRFLSRHLFRAWLGAGCWICLCIKWGILAVKLIIAFWVLRFGHWSELRRLAIWNPWDMYTFKSSVLFRFGT